jgi:hypothetical protein
MKKNLRYRPEEGQSLSMAVVNAVAQAHQEGVLEQDWVLQNDINPDALDELFNDNHLHLGIRFEADTSTVTIEADDEGNPVIEIESHR